MSAPLLKETQAHATRWLRWQLGDESDRPMPWELFADGLERQRDAARNVAEQYISKVNAHDAEVLGYRETIKALEAKLAQVEKQLASKDGYQAQPVDDGGPARDITLRDWFAGMALQGVVSGEVGEAIGLAVCKTRGNKHWRQYGYMELVALASYDYADAMLAARNGKEGA